MKVYMVGGAVRDKVMGREPKDIDYVVVGATSADMLAQGYQQVGADFPVFLHPVTGDEYALARQERKTGVGYNGFETVFDPTITLEDDLIRRDLTMNAMAMDLETGYLIDPYGGRADITNKVLRHTSDAFAEDPVRVLRTARFAARYGFTVAPETIELMKRVVDEIDHVPQERVWAEIEKGLLEGNPSRMFDVLYSCDAMSTDSLVSYTGADVTALTCVREDTPLSVRFILTALGFRDTDYEYGRVPANLAHVSKLYNRLQRRFVRWTELSTSDKLDTFEQLRVFSSNSNALIAMLGAAWLQYRNPVTQVAVLEDHRKVHTVDAAAIAASCTSGMEIRDKIRAARIAAMEGA